MSTMVTRLAISAVLAASAVVALPAAGVRTARAQDAATLPAIVDAFNARPLGSPGVRRVRLELRNSTSVTRTFDVWHAWRETADAVASFAFLQAPKGMAGTSYLLSEGPGLPTGLAVFLRLRLAGPRVLSIASGRFDEGLLGSDFSYADLLWRIPVAGRRLTLIGRRPLGPEMAFVVESRPVSQAVREATAWARVEYYFSSSALLLGADYYHRDARGPDPVKRLRTAGWTRSGDVWTPTAMVMWGQGGRSSVMTLTSLKLHVAQLEPVPFTPQSLAELGDEFQNGRIPALFGEDDDGAP